MVLSAMLVRLVDRFSRRSLEWLNHWVGLINWEWRVGELLSVNGERLQEVVTNHIQNKVIKRVQEKPQPGPQHYHCWGRER